jgi:hypothetical protein
MVVKQRGTPFSLECKLFKIWKEIICIIFTTVRYLDIIPVILDLDKICRNCIKLPFYSICNYFIFIITVGKKVAKFFPFLCLKTKKVEIDEKKQSL